MANITYQVTATTQMTNVNVIYTNGIPSRVELLGQALNGSMIDKIICFKYDPNTGVLCDRDSTGALLTLDADHVALLNGVRDSLQALFDAGVTAGGPSVLHPA